MSYFSRRRQQAITNVAKAEEAKDKGTTDAILKADSEPMQQTAQANQASNQAYQSQAPQAQPPVNDQIKAHRGAASAHAQAAKAHRVAGKAAVSAAPTVAAAHYQQAQSHDQQAQNHYNQAQSMQDAQDQGHC